MQVLALVLSAGLGLAAAVPAAPKNGTATGARATAEASQLKPHLVAA
jgi:hypothetical protein